MDEIINRCKNGDITAQSILYENYIKKVFKTAFLLCRNKDLAEDICQETFIRVFAKIYTFKGEAHSFNSWLYAVTLSVSKKHPKKAKMGKFLFSY